jgi:hypothetical protein
MTPTNAPIARESRDSQTLLQDCGILIPSWDGYADLWPPFFELFWKYWPDCPFPVYLGSNAKTFDDPRVTTIHAGSGGLWADRVRSQVASVDHDYVMLVLEDFFWRAPTRTDQVIDCLTALQDLGGHMMRLTNRPPPDRAVPGYLRFGEIAAGAPYRVSTQVTIWRRESLLDLMRPNESIWEFELKGSRRSDAIGDGFYCTWRQLVPYGYHVVERGKWLRHEAKRLSKNGVKCDFAARPIMSPTEALRWRMLVMRGRLQRLIPWRYQAPLKSAIRTLTGRSATRGDGGDV